MLNAMTHINWLAVAAAAIANFVLGGIWFAGVVAKPYRLALGIADTPPQKPGALFLVGPVLCSLATIVTSASLLRMLVIATIDGGLALGALVGLGYLVPMTLNIAINPLFPRPFLYTLLNAPYFIASSLLACAILVTIG